MSKIALTAAPVSPLIAERWSPRAYDDSHQLSQHELLSMLEAARWAPSSSNGQPWRFSVASRGDDLHEKVLAGLTGSNPTWAKNASALIVVSAKRVTAEGKPYRSAHYDAGLSVANLVLQAQELGLHSHQMGGFNGEALHAALELSDELEVLVVVAVGKLAPAETLEGTAYDREIAPRTRLSLEEIVLHGRP